MNDMAELNIDAALLSHGSSTALVQCEEKLISLANGCICCTLREDLLLQVGSLRLAQPEGLRLTELTHVVNICCKLVCFHAAAAFFGTYSVAHQPVG